jgi:hypothetical protein
MKGKIGSGGAPLQTITPRGNAEYRIVDIYHGTIGPDLLCRTIANTPANERRLRGMA